MWIPRERLLDIIAAWSKGLVAGLKASVAVRSPRSNPASPLPDGFKHAVFFVEVTSENFLHSFQVVALFGGSLRQPARGSGPNNSML